MADDTEDRSTLGLRARDRLGRCSVTAGSSNKKAGFCAGAVRVFHLVVLFVLIKGRVVLVVVPR